MPQDVHDCVDKLRDHPEVDNPWALCNWMQSEGYDLPSSEAEASSILEQATRARNAMQDHDNAALDGNKRPHTTKSAARTFSVKWSAQAEAELSDHPTVLSKAYPNARTIRLHGTFIDTTENLNGWSVPADELANIARQLKSGTVQLRLDHGEEVAKVIGLYDDGKLIDAAGSEIPLTAPPARLSEARRVDFGATVTLVDPNVAVPILRGYVRGTSPTLESRNVACATCGESAYPFPECDHFMTGAGVVLRDTTVKEGSIVASPAYGDRTTFMPVGFAAGLAKKRSEMMNMADPPNPANPAAAPPASAGWEAAMKATAEASELRARLAQFEAREKERADREANERKAADERKANEDKAKAEAEKKAAVDAEAKRLIEEQTRGLSLEQAVAARRTSSARAQTDAERVVGMPKRAFGAMAGTIDQQVDDAHFVAAFEEIKAAARRDPKHPLGLFGPQVDALRAGGDGR